MQIANINKLYLWLSFCGDALPNDIKRQTAKFILDRQARNGSFGHASFGDVFGTSCALRVLFNFHRIDRDSVAASIDYLKERIAAYEAGDDSYSMFDLYGLSVAQNVIQLVTSRNIFAESKVEIQPFLTRRFKLLQRPDFGYAMNRLARSSSLVCTLLGFVARQCGENTPYGGENRVPLWVRDFVASHALEGGGYFNSPDDPAPSVPATTSAVLLLKMAYAEFGPSAGDSFSCRNTFDFFVNAKGKPTEFFSDSEKIKRESIGEFYQSLIGMGALLDWNWHYLPHKVQALHSLQMFRRDDGGFAHDGTQTVSDVTSTFYGSVCTSLIAGGIIHSPQMKKSRTFTKTI